MRKTLLFAAFFIAMECGAAGVPAQVNYQGTLKDKGLPANGVKTMLFRITNQNGTQVYWSSGNFSVLVSSGLFSVQLSPTNVDWQNVTPFIEITVEGQQLQPREPVKANVYALMSQSVVDGAVTTAKIADAAVVSRAIADGAVTLTKLDPAVTNVIVPPGSIIAHAGTTAPPGWLACDGSAVSRTTYANLFAALSTKWGVGDGITTFNLPDLRGRAPIGMGQGPGLSNRPLAQALGEESHQLAEAEMPSHAHDITHGHTIADPGHEHGLSPSGAMVELHSPTGGGWGLAPGGGVPVNVRDTLPSSTQISVNNASGNSGHSGGSKAHNTMQPSAVVNFIIKY